MSRTHHYIIALTPLLMAAALAGAVSTSHIQGALTGRACGSTNDCPIGQWCKNRSCTDEYVYPCVGAGTCPKGYYCNASGICNREQMLGCSSDRDCSDGWRCNANGSCYLPLGGVCTSDRECLTNYCSTSVTGRSGGGTCVECVTMSDCPRRNSPTSGYQCVDGRCRENTSCADPGGCVPTKRCRSGTCVPAAANCKRDTDCGDFQYCASFAGYAKRCWDADPHGSYCGAFGDAYCLETHKGLHCLDRYCVQCTSDDECGGGDMICEPQGHYCRGLTDEERKAKRDVADKKTNAETAKAVYGAAKAEVAETKAVMTQEKEEYRAAKVAVTEERALYGAANQTYKDAKKTAKTTPGMEESVAAAKSERDAAADKLLETKEAKKSAQTEYLAAKATYTDARKEKANAKAAYAAAKKAYDEARKKK